MLWRHFPLVLRAVLVSFVMCQYTTTARNRTASPGLSSIKYTRNVQHNQEHTYKFIHPTNPINWLLETAQLAEY
ncbi:hypothetical protein L226DRAFT_64735 [Lentinus tigrinus ALCF2SS1-7]|uniref:uncharacterized protein n=1 Tax=Lentinus tigrinus ALCF2SS1-7 TaxID=1328758 RepID=UPI0011660EE9|nr:hypothetical protein L226DRAFT_64735 [Lentinus tigrinus ALCF2SS1-7]